MRWGLVGIGVGWLLAAACGDDDGSGGETGASASAGTSNESAPASAGDASADASADGASADGASADGGGDTCESVGGTCDCSGGCDPGWALAPQLDATCPQPGPDSGACSQSCCVPAGGSGSSGTGAGSGDGSGTADAAGSGGPEYCACEVSNDLPACPDAANCDGQVGEQCCDAMGRLNECTENDIGVVWLTQFC